MTTPHTASADELARLVAECKKLGMELAHVYSFVGDDSMPIAKARFESAVDTLAAYRTRPAPETAGEALCWTNPAPNASAPLVPSPCVTVQVSSATPAPAPAQRMSEEQERAAFEAALTKAMEADPIRFGLGKYSPEQWKPMMFDRTPGEYSVYCNNRTHDMLAGWMLARAAWGVKLEDDAS